MYIESSDAGTIPFGHAEALNPLGSCTANPDGPIADGTQLTDITQDPGLKNISGSSSAPSKSSTSEPQKTSSAPAAASTTEATVTSTENALDAQKLNAQFQMLTTDSSCSAGDQACIDSGFAMWVTGEFVNMGCAAPTKCFALPLVNKAGTSLTCTMEDDALVCITAPGATGGLTSSD
ncbi:hypothetical protein C8Q74DRAFT_1222713 [Fomes fomentarius]|nr:hypothetical protein C8Q74DRAFT_1222713 [Fomes fomentarius]